MESAIRRPTLETKVMHSFWSVVECTDWLTDWLARLKETPNQYFNRTADKLATTFDDFIIDLYRSIDRFRCFNDLCMSQTTSALYSIAANGTNIRSDSGNPVHKDDSRWAMGTRGSLSAPGVGVDSWFDSGDSRWTIKAAMLNTIVNWLPSADSLGWKRPAQQQPFKRRIKLQLRVSGPDYNEVYAVGDQSKSRAANGRRL